MQSGGYCFWCVKRKQLQSKWEKTKNNRWRHRNNYFRFWPSLPVKIDWFWSVSKNKTALRQLFTNWVLNQVKSEQFQKPLFLGGCHKENDAMCVSFVNRLVSVESLLECTNGEADDRILFHANHAIKIVNYGSVVISSLDADILVSSLHHFWKLKYICKSYGLLQVKEIPQHSFPFMISPII